MSFAFSRIEHIYSSNSAYVHALKDVSFEAANGEFISIVGPSGCGKSTLIRILSGLMRPVGGNLTVQGTPVEGPHSNVGIVFQVPALMAWRTVMDNVLLPIDVLQLRGDYRSRAMDLLKLVGLAEFADAYPDELSGGMQQRVAMCRALIYDPPVLLMDEPFGALDALTREQMNIELLRVWEASAKTILFVTHSIPEALFLSDRVLVMSRRPGRIIGDYVIQSARPRPIDILTDPKMALLAQEIRGKMAVTERRVEI